MKMKLTTVVIIAFMAVSLCPAANAAVGLGLSPSSISISDALKGGTYERTFAVFNTGNDIGSFGLTAEGECADWISFYKEGEADTPITEITISGKDKAKIIAKFDIPKDIANANYAGTIYAQTIPKESLDTEGAAAQAVIRIPSKITIDVTGTQILKGTVKSITTTDTEIDYPLKIKVLFQNEGNVVAKPKITVITTKDGEIIDKFVHDETGIKPESKDTILVLWNTTEQRTGDYTADVEVSLGDEALTNKNLAFKILPFGSLTRQGELISLTTQGDPLPGRMIKILADFENTGKIDSRAAFKGEIFRNGELVDVIESDEMLVEVGKTGRLTSYYKIESSDKYEVKGCVLYEGKETSTKEISFDVDSTNSKAGLFNTPGFSGLGLVLIITILFSMTRRFKV